MKTGEIPPLTGLRGVAALCVVLGHYSAWTLAVPRAEVPEWYWHWSGALPGIGMSIFFTLSGFVIALSYSHWDWRDRPVFSLVRLFLYRLARLYPAFLLFAILIVMRTPPLRELADPAAQAYIAPHLLLLQSWLPAKFDGKLVSGDAFHVSWSLSAEWGLYALFGLAAVVAAALPTFRHKAAILGAAFLATAIMLPELAWQLRSDLAPAGWSDGEWYLWLFGFSPWGVAFQFTMVNRWLSMRPLLHIGMVSYSLYLFHVFAAGLGGAGAMNTLSPSAAIYLAANFAICLTMAIMLASGIYFLVEVPGRRLIRRSADRLLRVQPEAAAPLQARA